MDKGKTGLLNDIAFWDSNYPDIAYLGIQDTKEEQDDQIYVYEKEGIRIAILNYTFGTNGIPLPEDMPYAVNLLDEQKIRKDMEKANAISDFQIVCPHWGTEYYLDVDESQKRWTRLFLENGVDLVIGAHPHVIEPIRMETDESGNQMLVYYSVGNFVNGTESYDGTPGDRMLGGMAKVTIGHDENGLHFIFNPAGNKTVDDLGLSASGTAIIKGAQGATGTATIATFTAGFILVMITLIVVLNLTRSRAGRAIMAIRDNRIAAQAIGLNLTKYKLMAFVTSAALAGAAGALYGLNYSSLQATKFNFNLSILVLVFVVLGGLGNIWGSLVAAAALTILPEALRQFADFRMLIYAIVLIFVMLATNNPQAKAFFGRLLPHRRAAAEKED